jgi:hypothetical protein
MSARGNAHWREITEASLTSVTRKKKKKKKSGEKEKKQPSWARGRPQLDPWDPYGKKNL